jgi:CheY-like chemotaxis protein
MAIEHSEEALLSSSDNQNGPTGVRVLVIDDNHDAADTLGVVLGMQGHDVRLCYDGKQAFAECRAFLPHVLFLDLGMPQMDGFRIAQQLRGDRVFAGLTIVALTGYADEAHRQRACAHFDHYLIKPSDLAEVEAILAGARSRLEKTV